MEPKDGCEELFFLTPNGSQYKQVYRKIIEANNLRVTKPPPPSDHQAVISTEAARNILCDLKHRKINKHLCHSDQTSERYYEFTNDDDATEAHTEIQKLIRKSRWHKKQL